MASANVYIRLAGKFTKRNGFLKVASGLFTRSQLRTASSTNSVEPEYDVAVVGGGIVGLATAQELITRCPQLRIVLLEKEAKLAMHQSGHNSGVIHAGIYYQPGSMKAKLCVEGMNLLYHYCDAHSIPYKKCGKLIVAVTPEETKQIRTLLERGEKNGVRDLAVLTSREIREYAPYCKGLQAIWSPHTGIIDYRKVCREYGNQFQKHGGDIKLNFAVAGFAPVAESQSPDSTEPLHSIRIANLAGSQQAVRARHVITAGGLYSDKLAQMSGGSPNPKIIPFRGEYLVLRPNLTHLATTNIYPVPDPRFPFLGVHFTPRMDGSVWLGPNAVLAFKREGYSVLDISFSDLLEFSSYPGLRKLAQKHLSFGLREMYRGLVMEAQVRQLQRYVPSLSPVDVTRGPAGVRAQALAPDGSLVDDFVFDCGLQGRVLHVRNAPSPAATSSLAIARAVVDRALDTFHL